MQSPRWFSHKGRAHGNIWVDRTPFSGWKLQMTSRKIYYIVRNFLIVLSLIDAQFDHALKGLGQGYLGREVIPMRHAIMTFFGERRKLRRVASASFHALELGYSHIWRPTKQHSNSDYQVFPVVIHLVQRQLQHKVNLCISLLRWSGMHSSGMHLSCSNKTRNITLLPSGYTELYYP